MLSVIGFDYKDDVCTMRRIYGLDKEGRIAVEKRVFKENRPEAMAMLITCTRVEFYCISTSPVSFESAERALGLNHIGAKGHRYRLEGKEAAVHLYLLSSGILSPLFGEDTIISQISEALGRAVSTGQGSSAMNRLLSDSVSFSRKLRRDRKIRVFDHSIAVRTAEILSGCKDVLVIGSGELARGVAGELAGRGFSVGMTLRDMGKTFLLVPGVHAVPYEERRAHAAAADAVVSASSGLYHTLDENDIDILSGKKVIDLAVPYDIPSGLSPIRLEDMDVKTPEKDGIVLTVRAMAEDRAEDYFASIGFLDFSMRAEDVALETVRRLYGHVSSLKGLDEEEKKSLLDSVADSVRKAYVAKERLFQKTMKSLE